MPVENSQGLVGLCGCCCVLSKRLVSIACLRLDVQSERLTSFQLLLGAKGLEWLLGNI